MALLLGLAFTGAVFAQDADQAQDRDVNPTSNKASNIEPGSPVIADQLPQPTGGRSLSDLLRDAKSALQSGQTGEAQEALEEAETRALTRSVPYNAGNQAIQGPVVTALSQARQDLGRHDIAGAEQAVGAAQAAAMAPPPNPPITPNP